MNMFDADIISTYAKIHIHITRRTKIGISTIVQDKIAVPFTFMLHRIQKTKMQILRQNKGVNEGGEGNPKI